MFKLLGIERVLETIYLCLNTCQILLDQKYYYSKILCITKQIFKSQERINFLKINTNLGQRNLFCYYFLSSSFPWHDQMTKEKSNFLILRRINIHICIVYNKHEPSQPTNMVETGWTKAHTQMLLIYFQLPIYYLH